MSVLGKGPAIEEEDGWATLCAWLPTGWQTKMRELGAFQRAREVRGPDALLRLVLAYPLLKYSLSQVCRWARGKDLADLTEESLWQRFKHCGAFLRWLVPALLWVAPPPTRLRLTPVDATSFTMRRDKKHVWRAHLNWADGVPIGLQVDKAVGPQRGESLRRWVWEHTAGVLLADRAYGTPPQLGLALAAGRDFVVRFSWHNLPLFATPVGGPRLDPQTQLGSLHPGETRDFRAWIRPAQGPPREVRIVVIRKLPAATAQAVKKVRRRAGRNGQKLRADTVFLADFVALVTNLEATVADPQTILDMYRWRWQIEREFRRLKGITEVRCLPVFRDCQVEVYLLALLAGWLLVHRLLRERVFFPWGYPLDAAPGAGCHRASRAGRTGGVGAPGGRADRSA